MKKIILFIILLFCLSSIVNAVYVSAPGQDFSFILENDNKPIKHKSGGGGGSTGWKTQFDLNPDLVTNSSPEEIVQPPNPSSFESSPLVNFTEEIEEEQETARTNLIPTTKPMEFVKDAESKSYWWVLIGVLALVVGVICYFYKSGENN